MTIYNRYFFGALHRCNNMIEGGMGQFSRLTRSIAVALSSQAAVLDCFGDMRTMDIP